MHWRHVLSLIEHSADRCTRIGHVLFSTLCKNRREDRGRDQLCMARWIP